MFGGKPVSEAKCDARGGDWEGDSGLASLFAPTSCGALNLNDGAVLLDIGGEVPVPVGEPTDGLCVAVVDDLDGGGIDPSGIGDEDDDGLSDYEEACVAEYADEGADPCVQQDNDLDGVHDLVDADDDNAGVDDVEDSCPFEGVGTNSDGMIVGVDGCLRNTMCNNDADDDSDSFTDWDGNGGDPDPSCDDNEDDDEFPFDGD